MPYSNTSEMCRKLEENNKMLRESSAIKRGKVSQSVKDMVKYMNDRIYEDPLINPVKENPFRVKSKCSVL